MVMENMRQLTTAMKAENLLNLSAVASVASPARRQDLMTLKHFCFPAQDLPAELLDRRRKELSTIKLVPATWPHQQSDSSSEDGSKIALTEAWRDIRIRAAELGQ